MDGDNHNAPCFSLAGLVWLSATLLWHQASRLFTYEFTNEEVWG